MGNWESSSSFLGSVQGSRLSFAAMIVAACGPGAPTGAGEHREPVVSVAPHVEYYGYFCDSCRGVGDRDNMADVADHANFSFIFHDEDGAGERAKLDAARALGLEGILNVSTVFGATNFSSLHPEFRQRWAQYAANVRPRIDDVLAFYLADEPELRVFLGEDRVPWDLIKGQLEEATSLIHETFPGIPVMMNFSNYGAVHELPAPSNVDWVGFFCYGPWDDCMGSGASVPEALRRVKRASQPHQRLFLIPEATSFFYDAVHVPVDVAGMEANLDRYADLASSEPRVIALMTFTWQSMEGMQGADAFPGVAARSRAIGRAITRRGDDAAPPPVDPPPPVEPPPAPAPEPPASPPPADPGAPDRGRVVGVLDGIFSIEGQPMLQGWACGRGIDASISVHLYVGGAAGVGEIVEGYSASEPSEGAVAAACGANGSNYRFRIALGSLHEAHAGRPIFVHGISPSGMPNDLLNASGQFSVP